MIAKIEKNTRDAALAVFAALALLAMTSCATRPAAPPKATALPSKAMKTCVEGAAPARVGLESFSVALQNAQRHSDKVYGEDCFVCAEVYDDTDTYFLHITSPIEDMLINTSAGITVRKSDGKVMDQNIWHSCHARVKSSTKE
jgi:hypothetical protein